MHPNPARCTIVAIDSIIAGRFIGREALAAEGIAVPVMNLVILAITGLCIGAGVLMSERYGAKDLETLKQTLATMLGTFIQTFLRTVCTFLLAPRFGITGIAFSCCIGWTCMLIFEIPYYFYTCKKQGLEGKSPVS